MGIYKIIAFAAALSLTCACEQGSDVAKLKAENEELRKEYKELKELNDRNKQTIAKHSETISQTLEELTKINGQTLTLKQDYESGNAKVSQADKISYNLETLRKRLDNLERTVKDNADLRKTVVSLREIITRKEIEIDQLREVIAKQSDTIESQKVVISDQSAKIDGQSATIEEQNEQLHESWEKQIELIYTSGLEFERISNMDIDVSMKKNKIKVQDFQNSLKIKALEHYKAAADMGHVEARAAYDRLHAELNIYSE